MSLFHQHLLIRCHVQNPPRAESELNAWMLRLVQEVGMKVCLPPHSKYVDTPGNEGLTGNVGIETSHFAIHIWDDVMPALVQADLYSCKAFKSKTVRDMLNEFGLLDFEMLVIDRNNKLTLSEYLKS